MKKYSAATSGGGEMAGNGVKYPGEMKKAKKYQ